MTEGVAYAEVIRLIALSVLTDNADRARELTLEANGLHDGFVGASKVKKAVVREVMADVIEQMMALYVSELVPRIRTNISAEAGDEAEAYLGEVLRREPGQDCRAVPCGALRRR